MQIPRNAFDVAIPERLVTCYYMTRDQPPGRPR